ncbi:type IV pilus modification PilV family protein [Andreprevotia chitinilytica]|uniref:type IV pilus modification PilV family protein n=1 Tax=Andreprevotia chitinilytica TaxID=396808 RepID=UPI00068A950F|nr:prepilin-type N-terminal cleavage/methylation domain-containing protein [Andreprevotia chitinilytica]
MAIRSPTQQGYLLLEVLVSLLIFSIGILGLVAALVTSTRTSVATEDRNRAALLANEMAVILLANKNVTPSAATLSTWQSHLAVSAGSGGQTNSGLNGLPNATGTVVSTPTAGFTTGTATITISWIEPKSAASATPITDSYTTEVVVLP